MSKLLKRLVRGLTAQRYDRFTIIEHLRREGAQIGQDCSIVPQNLGTEPYLVKIGNHVTIATGVKFMTHDGGVWIFRQEIPDLQVFGPIVIEDNSVIGENAILFPGIRIGPNSIVGAGSVVINDIPPNTIAIGVPARPFGSVTKYKEKCIERWKQQCPPDILVESGSTWWNSRHFQDNREKLRKHLLQHFSQELSNVGLAGEEGQGV